MKIKEYPEFAGSIIDMLESLGIEYAIGGSFASSVYGQARTTIDIDISIVLPFNGVQLLVEAVKKLQYHTSVDEILDALIHKMPVNIIDPSSSYKADIFLVEPTPLEASILARKRREVIDLLTNKQAWLYSPEDVILYKMIYFLNGKSPKHLRDIGSMLVVQGDRLDYDYISRWSQDIKATELWNQLLSEYYSRKDE